jgi:hypothetical protein
VLALATYILLCGRLNPLDPAAIVVDAVFTPVYDTLCIPRFDITFKVPEDGKIGEPVRAKVAVIVVAVFKFEIALNPLRKVYGPAGK